MRAAPGRPSYGDGGGGCVRCCRRHHRRRSRPRSKPDLFYPTAHLVAEFPRIPTRDARQAFHESLAICPEVLRGTFGSVRLICFNCSTAPTSASRVSSVQIAKPPCKMPESPGIPFGGEPLFLTCKDKRF